MIASMTMDACQALQAFLRIPCLQARFKCCKPKEVRGRKPEAPPRGRLRPLLAIAAARAAPARPYRSPYPFKVRTDARRFSPIFALEPSGATSNRRAWPYRRLWAVGPAPSALLRAGSEFHLIDSCRLPQLCRTHRRLASARGPDRWLACSKLTLVSLRIVWARLATLPSDLLTLAGLLLLLFGEREPAWIGVIELGARARPIRVRRGEHAAAVLTGKWRSATARYLAFAVS